MTLHNFPSSKEQVISVTPSNYLLEIHNLNKKLHYSWLTAFFHQINSAHQHSNSILMPYQCFPQNKPKTSQRHHETIDFLESWYHSSGSEFILTSSQLKRHLGENQEVPSGIQNILNYELAQNVGGASRQSFKGGQWMKEAK